MSTGQRHRRQRLGEITEAIYDAAVSGDWSDTAGLLRRHYRSIAESLYILDFDQHTIREVYKAGIEPAYFRTLDEQFFTPDNPWRKVPFMHEPGSVRTDRRLARHFRDPDILRRSRYYNEWLRPQRLEHSLGTTMLVDGGAIANITLHRPADAGHYSAVEIADLERLGGHLRRALSIAQRLELQAAHREAGAAALDRLPYGVAFLAADGRLAYANRVTETLLRHNDGLRLRDGRLAAVDHRNQARLERLLRATIRAVDGTTAPDSIDIARHGGAPPLRLTAIRAPSVQRPLAAGAPAILLLIGDPTAAPAELAEPVQQLYRLTAAEARLAQALVEGRSLRQAAADAGITYQTVRSYLKILFQKTGTSRQAELVVRLLRDRAALPGEGE